MKKYVFLLQMAFVVCHGLNAQNTGEQKLFNLVLPDNTVVSYELTDGVDIHFEDSIMVVNDLSFYMEDIVKYYFTGVGNDGTQQISLFESGWNWWSGCVELNGNSLTQLQDDLGTNGLSIKSQNQFVNYNANTGRWTGSLRSINNESAYMINMSVATDITLTGMGANPADHPITLKNGWSWIGYPTTETMSVGDAMSNITPSVGDQVKSQGSFATYNGTKWNGSLKNIEPGKGYMYKSNSSDNVTLIYPSGSSKGEYEANITAENNHWVPNVHAHPTNMTMMAVVELDEVELAGEHYELAAFANGECRGSARLMEVDGRHIAFLTIAGEETAELYFGLYDAEKGESILGAEERLQYEANATVGSLAEPYVVSFGSTTGIVEEPESHIAGDKLYVRSAGKDGSVVVADVLGRVVFSQPIREEACVIDLNLLAPNTLYIIKVNNQTLKFIRQ